MTEPPRPSLWTSSTAYESFVGRWSRVVAGEFLDWLDVPDGAAWLDVGCGTGALSDAILTSRAPASVVSIDPSEAFVGFARQRLRDARVTVAVGHAEQLEASDTSFDAAVSGLVLNFVPNPSQAVREFARVVRGGGSVGVYVWDYAGDMQMLRLFWDAARAMDPTAAQFDEAAQFSICRPEPLRQLFVDAGLERIEHRTIDVPTEWPDFDAFWAPFLGGTGTAPAFVASLSDHSRAALRERLRTTVPVASDGAVRLVARAWAIKGHRP